MSVGSQPVVRTPRVELPYVDYPDSWFETCKFVSTSDQTCDGHRLGELCTLVLFSNYYVYRQRRRIILRHSLPRCVDMWWYNDTDWQSPRGGKCRLIVTSELEKCMTELTNFHTSKNVHMLNLTLNFHARISRGVIMCTSCKSMELE